MDQAFGEVKAEGFKELMEQFETFASPRLQRKLLQNALKEGARPVKEDAERRLGKGGGYIGTGTPRKRYLKQGTVAAIGIGIKSEHWQVVFQEFGTYGRERYTKKGYRRGIIVARPFLRPALDSQKQNAVDRMKKYLELALSAFFERKNKDVPTVPEVT